jgi:hypothetical protein
LTRSCSDNKGVVGTGVADRLVGGRLFALGGWRLGRFRLEGPVKESGCFSH